MILTPNKFLGSNLHYKQCFGWLQKVEVKESDISERDICMSDLENMTYNLNNKYFHFLLPRNFIYYLPLNYNYYSIVFVITALKSS